MMIIYDDNDDECCKERERATSVFDTIYIMDLIEHT